MFDIFAKVGKKTTLRNHYTQENSFYSGKKFHTSKFSYKNFQLLGLSHTDEGFDFVETSSHLLCVLGNIFLRYEYKHINDSAVSAKEMLKLLNEDPEYYKKIKGSFVICWYLKETGEIIIINDQFAITPFYYCELGEEIYLTNNLNNFKQFSLKINNVAMLESILFSYHLTGETYYKGVFLLKGGEQLSIKNGKITSKQNFNLAKFVFNNNFEIFDYSRLTKLFNYCVLQRVNKSSSVTTSLTGGFDGRAVVSSLLEQNIPFRAYSFGKFGGENTQVPLSIARKIKLSYSPIYLEKEYEQNYAKFAREAIYFSDGYSIFERANYPYAYNQLARFSNIVLSGLLAGEIIGAVHQKTDYINAEYYDVIYDNIDMDFKEILSKKGMLDYIDNHVIGKSSDEILAHIEGKKKEVKTNKTKEFGYLYYLYDLLKLGFRRFYGTEIHLNRFYADNLTPFFDIDILSMLLNTNHKIIYKNAFKSSVLNRRKNRFVQAKIIQSNFSDLADIPVDRGYPPAYLFHPIKKYSIPFFFYNRRRRLENTTKEFTSDVWCEFLYKDINEKELIETKIFNKRKVLEHMKNYNKYLYNQKYNKVLSLYLWFGL